MDLHPRDLVQDLLFAGQPDRVRTEIDKVVIVYIPGIAVRYDNVTIAIVVKICYQRGPTPIRSLDPGKIADLAENRVADRIHRPHPWPLIELKTIPSILIFIAEVIAVLIIPVIVGG